MDTRVATQLLEAEAERLRRVRELLGEERREAAAATELSSFDQHQADAGSDVFDAERDRSVLDRIDNDLLDVADALARLGAGTYGACESCGAPIDDDRLRAVPATRFCAEHEVLWEGTRMTTSVPAGVRADEAAFADDIAAMEAGRHLEFLPQDDEVVDRVELGPEELALHVVDARTGAWLGRRETETELAD